MAEDRHARPVSGEIITGPGLSPRSRPAATEVTDAEFETLDRGSARQAETGPSAQAFSQEPPALAPAGLDVLKSKGEGAAPSARGGPAFWVFGLALAAAAFWVSGGHALISQPPSTVVATTPGHAFAIVDVTSRIEDAGGRSVLFVDGATVNSGNSGGPLPPMEIRVTGKDGRVVRYKLGTSSRELAPGARFTFSSRLEAPRDGVKSVQVDFTDEEN